MANSADHDYRVISAIWIYTICLGSLIWVYIFGRTFLSERKQHFLRSSCTICFPSNSAIKSDAFKSDGQKRNIPIDLSSRDPFLPVTRIDFPIYGLEKFMKQFCGFQIKIIDFPLGAEFFAFVTPGIDNFISTSMESINSWQTFNEDAQCQNKISTIFLHQCSISYEELTKMAF